MIEITEQQYERVHLLLNEFPKQVPRVFYNAMKRGMTAARTRSKKAITEHYNIRQQDLAKRTKMKISYNNGTESLSASLTFAGNVIPLQQFKVSPSKPQRGTVSVAVLRSEGGKRLQHAYYANLGRYGPGVFERMTSKRATSQQLYGPSAAHMMGRPGVQEDVAADAQKTVDSRVEHEITRILNGYGV